MNIHAAIEDYLECKMNALTQSTYKWYRWALARFEQWCHAHNITELSQITAAQVQRFVRANPDASDNTKHHRAQVVKGFLRWCSFDEELGIQEKTVQRIEMPKVAQVEIEIYSEEEITRLLAACEHTRYCLRNRAIVLLLLDTGIRLSELCYDGSRPEEATGLLLENVTFGEQENYITVMGKGRKTRTVKFGRETCQVLQEYLQGERPESTLPYVFLAQGESPLSIRELNKILRYLGKQAHVTNVHAHRFRHTFAIRQLLARTPAFALMEIMGHASLESTKLYMRALTQAHARQISVSVVDEMWKEPQSVRDVFVREASKQGKKRKNVPAKEPEPVKEPELVAKLIVPPPQRSTQQSSEDPHIYEQWTLFFCVWWECQPGVWLTTSRVADLFVGVLPERMRQAEGEHPKAFLYRLRTALAICSGFSYGDKEPVSVRCWPAAKRGMNLWQVYQVKAK